MSEAPSESARKPARPLNRWGMGTLSVLQIALLALILIALNYLAVHYYGRIDASRGADYSLSPATRSYLKSEAVQAREKPITMIMAFRRVSPFYERVRALAEEYERVSDRKIDLKVVDPIRSPDRMQEINAAYGLTLVRDLIIIDARSDESPVTTEGADRIKVLNPHVKFVVAEEMALFATAEGKRKISGFQGEDVLTARVVESIEGKPRKMALIADKSRIQTRDESPSRKALEDLLRFQNVELTEVQLAGLDEIPADISGVVLAAPKYDLTEKEIAVLENYWNQPRAAFLVFIDGGEAPPKLRAFLRGNGITPRSDRVIASGKDGLVTTARGIFTQGIPFTRDLAGQTTEFGGATSSLDVREGAEDLLNRRIYPMGVIQVADGFWGETKFGQGDETFNEQEDNAPPLYLAASATRGAQADDRFAADTSRMVVISNMDFLNPANHRAENLDFLASSVNWLVGREALAGIGPRSLGTYKLPLLQAQVSFINRVNLFFLPAALLLIGAFIWSSRRV
jgi:hypothetical protein